MNIRPLIGALASLLILTHTNVTEAGSVQNRQLAPGVRVVNVPDPDAGNDTLAERAAAQAKTAGEFRVFYQFHFTDKLRESGITFRHHAVSDALQTYKAIHYDHGGAVAVADVDGDGLYDILFTNQVGGNELWKNLGGGKFRNITDQAGIALKGLMSVGAAFADIDNDGDQDLVITTIRGGVHL